ncbi:MAG: hypothetical protein N3A64_05410 [Desulfobacterota bacterium]|nr:hypothetical protein [Thermodesulfobacteriota bacterium]
MLMKIMEREKLRVAIFARLYKENGLPISLQKEKLRQEVWDRGYEIVAEFWEEDLPSDISLEERQEMKRFITAVWTNTLNIDGIFIIDFENLSLISRKEYLNLMIFFEQNDIMVITREGIYCPDEWMAGLSF